MSELGSLTQSARKNELKSARGILFFVGIMTLLVNGFMFANAENEIKTVFDAEVQKIQQQGMMVDQNILTQEKAKGLQLVRLIYGGGAALGAVFCLLGAMIYKKPVPIVILALILYLGGNAMFGMLNPASLLQGIIIKVFIVVGLVKSVQAAIAYEKERQAQPEPEPTF